MNRLLTFFALSIAIASPALSATQNITCNFADPSNHDKIVISLTDTQSGTFYYSLSGDTSPTDGMLPLTRTDLGNRDFASFENSNESLEMTFKFPIGILQKAGTGIKTTLTTSIQVMNTTQDQALICDSKI